MAQQQAPGLARGLALERPSVLAAALDLVVPQACAGCGRPGSPWCGDCHRCAWDPARVPGSLPCWAAAPHAGPVGRAVVAHKDAGSRRLGRPLSALLAGSVAQVLADAGVPRAGPVWLVPVPGRPSSRRRRGFDPVAVLAAGAAALLRRRGLAVHRIACLVHLRDSRDQVGLSAIQRRANVAGTLGGRPPPAGWIVLVDDVTTTGATLAEAARAVRGQVRGQGSGPPRAVLAATVTWSPGRAAPRFGAPGALAW